MAVWTLFGIKMVGVGRTGKTIEVHYASDHGALTTFRMGQESFELYPYVPMNFFTGHDWENALKYQDRDFPEDVNMWTYADIHTQRYYMTESTTL